MVTKDVRFKRICRFIIGLYTSVFSALGWVIVGDLSANKYVWWVVVPIILTIAIVTSNMTQAWVYEKE